MALEAMSGEDATSLFDANVRGTVKELAQLDGAFTVAETRQIPEVLTTAIRTALSGRPGPVFVEIPVDRLMTPLEDGSAIETATIGYEGMVGIYAFLGGGTIANAQAMAQVPGSFSWPYRRKGASGRDP